MESDSKLPYPIQIIILIGIYAITARLSLKVDLISGFAALVWPPTGVALAALLLFGLRLWPAIFLGTLVVGYRFNDLGGSLRPTPLLVGSHSLLPWMASSLHDALRLNGVQTLFPTKTTDIVDGGSRLAPIRPRARPHYSQHPAHTLGRNIGDPENGHSAAFDSYV